MKCKKLLAFALTAALFVSACTQVFAAANVSETDAAADAAPQTTASQLAESTADEAAEEVVVTEEETVSVQEKQVQANEGETSGTCGDSLNWSYNTSTCVLTISGSGAMTSHPWSGYKNSIEQVKFSGNITSICEFAFNNCKNLERITIPASVESIGGGAFFNCINLESVTFASGSKLTTINTTGYSYVEGSGYGYYGAFEGCKNLEKIVIPNSVTSMGNYAFNGCTNLETVVLSNNLEAIKYCAFYNCENLQGITLGAKTTSIGNYAFGNCGKMTYVKLNNELKTIGEFAFNKCYALTNITIPASVETINGGAFYGLKNLKSVTFASESKLTAINTTGYSYVEGSGYGYYGAFEDCTSLNSIVFSDNITIINKETLIGCTSLKTVTIGKHVTDIAESAFSGCTSLTEVIIPKAVNAIQKNAFNNCSALTTVKYTGTQARWNTLKNDGIDSDGNSYLLNAKNFVYNYSPLASVAVKTNPTKTVYTIGETFSSAGLKLTATYENGTTKEITSGFTCSPSGKLNTAGQQKITVTYQGKTTGFNVTVNKIVSSIAMKKLPTKKVYTVGESFNQSGMIVKVTYTDGTTEKIVKGFTCSPSKLNTVGQQKIVVAYKGKGTGFYVTVKKAVSSVAIQAKPTKTVYNCGDTFNPAGMKLKVTYADNTTEVLTDGFTYSPTGKLTTAGQQKITVTFGGKSVAFNVTVNKVVSVVAVKAMPTKRIYTVGESFNSAGLKLKVTYTDNTTAEIASGFTCTPGKLTTVGQQKIVVSYKGKSTGFYVTVERPASSITIKTLPTKKVYMEGDTFNPAGMKVKVTYADGTVKEITSGFTCSHGKLNIVGQQKIVVSYGGKSTGFYVTVNKAIQSVTIKKLPTKRTYKVGETFSSSGMVLKVTYTDNTTAEVSSGFTCTPSGKLNTKGQQKIVVSYQGKATGFYVTVA